MVQAILHMDDINIFNHLRGILRFSDFQEHEVYNAIRTQEETLFMEHSEFRIKCAEMSARAINGRIDATSNSNKIITHQNIAIAVKYIFSEIPFFINTPDISNVETSMLAYHRPWPIGRSLFPGGYPLSVSKFQGFVQLSDEPPNPAWRE
jgi:tRNA-dependent cyclodipeptide synthase